MPKKGSFEKVKVWPFFVFYFLHLFFPPKNHEIFIKTIFLCHGPLSSFYLSTSFASPTAKPIGPCQWITYVFRGPWTPWSLWHFVLGVNRSGPGRVQQPIAYFTGPWNDFMVHGVNNPWPCLELKVLTDRWTSSPKSKHNPNFSYRCLLRGRGPKKL